MKFVSHSSMLFTSQDSDTLSVSRVLPVKIPFSHKLNLKVEKPSLRVFDFENAKSVGDTVGEQVVLPEKPAKVMVDSLGERKEWPSDSVFFGQFQPLDTNLFPGVLSLKLPTDGVTFLTYGNYYVTMVQEQDHRDDSEVLGVSEYIGKKEQKRQSGKKDTLSGGHKASQWVGKMVKDRSGMENLSGYSELALRQEWFLSVIILAVAITGFLKFRWSKYLRGVFDSVLYSGAASALRANKSGISRAASFWSGFLFYLNSSLFVFEILSLHHRTLIGFSGWKLLVLIMAFLFVLFMGKILAYKFVGWVFKTSEKISEHIFRSALLAKAYALVLVPLVVLFPFANDLLRQWLFGTGVGAFILLYLIQIGREIVINLRDLSSGYYIILYLCALEILPLSILYRVLLY